MADTVAAEVLAALDRAVSQSGYTTATFVDAIEGIAFGDIKKANEAPRPSFTAGALVPPGSPDAIQSEAMRQLVTSAATTFANQFFPVEDAVSSAGVAVRAWLANAAQGNIQELPGIDTPGTYAHAVAQYFHASADTHPDYVPAPRADEIDAHVAETYAAASAVTQQNIARDLYEFALAGIPWQNRGAAMQAVAGYITAASDMETSSAEDQIRIQNAKSSMQGAMAKWIGTQAEGDYSQKVRTLRATADAQAEAGREHAMFAAVDARVKAATAGAAKLVDVVRAARNAITSVIAQNKIGSF
jgi:hypothetical protein